MTIKAYNNALNLPDFIYGYLGLPGANLVSVFDDSLDNGTRQEVYTCPVGKRAMVQGGSIQFYNSTAGALTNTIELKVSGNYYPSYVADNLNAYSVVARGLSSTMSYIMEAGETIVLTASGAGMRAKVTVLDFDANFPLYSPKLLTLASGDNAIYTCPANKKAVPGRYGVPTDLSYAFSCLFYFNASGGSRNVYFTHTPNGGSVTSIYGTTAVADDASLSSGAATVPTLVAGDVLGINTNAATDTQWAFTTVLELPA